MEHALHAMEGGWELPDSQWEVNKMFFVCLFLTYFQVGILVTSVPPQTYAGLSSHLYYYLYR